MLFVDRLDSVKKVTGGEKEVNHCYPQPSRTARTVKTSHNLIHQSQHITTLKNCLNQTKHLGMLNEF